MLCRRYIGDESNTEAQVIFGSFFTRRSTPRASFGTPVQSPWNFRLVRRALPFRRAGIVGGVSSTIRNTSIRRSPSCFQMEGKRWHPLLKLASWQKNDIDIRAKVLGSRLSPSEYGRKKLSTYLDDRCHSFIGCEGSWSVPPPMVYPCPHGYWACVPWLPLVVLNESGFLFKVSWNLPGTDYRQVLQTGRSYLLIWTRSWREQIYRQAFSSLSPPMKHT